VSERVGVWSWQDAIRQANVPPGTKLLCLTISLYVSSVGRGAWPSVDALVADTGMKHRAIAAHLKHAQKAGLLAMSRARRLDGTLGHYTYFPRFPDDAGLPSEPSSVGVELLPPAKSADGRHNGKHHPQILRGKRTTQERGYKGKDSLPHSRGGAEHAKVVPQADVVALLNAWGAGE
jgi:hypothetical protein